MATVRTSSLAFGFMLKTNKGWNQNCQILHAVGDKHTHARNTKQSLYESQTRRQCETLTSCQANLMYTGSVLRYLVTHKKLNKTITIVMDKLLSEIYAVGK